MRKISLEILVRQSSRYSGTDDILPKRAVLTAAVYPVDGDVRW